MKQRLTGQQAAVADQDVELFRAAVGEVAPLPDQNRILAQITPRKPVPHIPAARIATPDALSDGCAVDAPAEFLRDGVSRTTLRKLRRSPIEATLDLHGSHIDEARRLLQDFLHEAAQHGLRHVLVIHGKGINSQGGAAVLRKLTRHWLMQRPDVLAYCEAPAREGGSGAALLLLKAPRQT